MKIIPIKSSNYSPVFVEIIFDEALQIRLVPIDLLVWIVAPLLNVIQKPGLYKGLVGGVLRESRGLGLVVIPDLGNVDETFIDAVPYALIVVVDFGRVHLHLRVQLVQ